MDNCWKKESNRKDALFIDIFNPRLYIKNEQIKVMLSDIGIECLKEEYYVSQERHQRKSNIEAVNERNAGNLLFARKKYREAMECYNKSLCLSEVGSENISLAYANRSTCFLEMKLFDRCLFDIDLAINAGYPKDKMDKLEKRRSDATKAIEDGHLVQPHNLNSHFNSNKKVPVVDNAIQIENDPENGNNKRFIAAEDISVGQTIYMEPCLIGVPLAGKYLMCNICLHQNECLMPCNKCTVAMFCVKCKKNKLHKFECGLKQSRRDENVAQINYFLLVARLIIKAVQLFPNVDALIAFVKKTMANRSTDIPDFNDPKSIYRAFLSLKNEDQMPTEMVVMFKMYYQLIMDQPKIACIFHSKKYKRFLMHLIAQHLSIAYNGSSSQRFQYISPTEKLVFEIQLAVLRMSFKHSCAPNMIYTLDNGVTAGIVVRPIIKGEEITVNQFDIGFENGLERHLYIFKKTGKTCNCEHCYLPIQSIEENPIYQRNIFFKFILTKLGISPQTISRDELHELIMSCEYFLEMYGREQWCKEIELVVQFYSMLLGIRDMK